MLHFICNLKLLLRTALVIVITIAGFDMLVASDDWVHDLRYKEFMTKAEQGDGVAMYELGVMTERGHGTEKSIDKAIEWYKKAIKNKNSSAYVRLGKLYLEGVYVKKDYKKSFDYLNKAKKNDSPGAYYYLAVMYENGYATKRNLSLAKVNYDKASKWGHFGAKAKSNEITAKLEKIKKTKELSNFPVREKQTKIVLSTEIKKPKPKKVFVTINEIKKSLLTGMWFNGDKPVGFLPSPRTYCIPKKKVGLRCVSKEMTKNTGREKVYYLIESKITNIDNDGAFVIKYKNKVTKVDVYQPKSESGEIYVSRIKVGPQAKEHVLTCNVTGKNINCNKNGIQNYVFVDLFKKKEKNKVFEFAFE